MYKQKTRGLWVSFQTGGSRLRITYFRLLFFLSRKFSESVCFHIRNALRSRRGANILLRSWIEDLRIEPGEHHIGNPVFRIAEVSDKQYGNLKRPWYELVIHRKKKNTRS